MARPDDRAVVCVQMGARCLARCTAKLTIIQGPALCQTRLRKKRVLVAISAMLCDLRASVA
eukprot:357977-Chlamydomonas_euryale.AAC.3